MTQLTLQSLIKASIDQDNNPESLQLHERFRSRPSEDHQGLQSPEPGAPDLLEVHILLHGSGA